VLLAGGASWSRLHFTLPVQRKERNMDDISDRKHGYLVFRNDHSLPTNQPEYIGEYETEKEARKAAAKALGRDNLRGLFQDYPYDWWSPEDPDYTVRYYDVGATDDLGMSVDIVFPKGDD